MEVKGDSEVEGKFTALWDDQWFYVYMEVKDPNIVRGEESPKANDRITYYFDFSNKKPFSYTDGEARGAYIGLMLTDDTGTDLLIEQTSLAAVENKAAFENSFKKAMKVGSGSYSVEVAFKVKDLYPEIKQQAGTKYAFDAYVHDFQASVSERVCGHTWVDSGNTSWNDPSRLGSLTLLAKPSTEGTWKEVNGKHYFYDKDDVLQKNQWILSKGKYYYVGSDGAMLVNTWVGLSGKWYYVDANGVRQTGWELVKGKYYYLNNDGSMVTGWKNLNGKYYYLDKSTGIMATGWKNISGKYYYFDSKSGVMKANAWVKSSGKYYYVDKNGGMLTNKWVKSGGKWYYVDASGKMLSSTTKKIGKKTYKFNGSGICTNP
jgi:glucan-binding YG repeat protein